MVEHLLAKEKVASSSLAARSFFYREDFQPGMATWPSGKARVCKTLIIGSNPIVASNFLKTLREGFFVFFISVTATADLFLSRR